MTSFAVLRSNRTNEIKLVFGANQISSVEGLRVSDYLKKVLYIVSQMDRLDVYGKAFVRRAIFKYVFTWNRGRVEAYFKGLTRFLQQCLEHNTECHGK